MLCVMWASLLRGLGLVLCLEPQAAAAWLLELGSDLLVLILYCKLQRLRSATHLFLVNISLNDLLVFLFTTALPSCHA